MLAIEPLQREGEQRQRILGAAFLDVGKQRIDEGLLDLERALGAFEPPRRTLDDLGIGAFRHGRQAKRMLAQALQALGGLQPLVAVGADGEERDQRGCILGGELAQKVEKGAGFLGSFRMEQLFGLIDGKDQRRGLARPSCRRLCGQPCSP